MCRLYKDKYILALYDKEDIVGVFDNIRDMFSIFRGTITYTHLTRVVSDIYLNRDKQIYGLDIIFIDAFKVEDDIFSEEDKIFINYIENEIKRGGSKSSDYDNKKILEKITI